MSIFFLIIRLLMEYCFFSPIDLLLVEIGKIAVMLIILKCNILFL